MSDGLVPPLNAPPAGQPVAGVQPGTTPGIVLAQYVIVFGTAGGVFIYTGSPGPGNPPILWSASSNKDPYGNTLSPESTASIGAGQDGGAQVLLTLLSGTDGQISFPLPGTWTNYPNMYATVSGSGAILSVNGPTDSTVDDQVFIALDSAEASGLAGSTGFLVYEGTGPSNNTVAFWNYAGLTVEAGVITAVEPGTGTSPANPAQQETWHAITLDSGWSTGSPYAAPRYRLLPDGNLQLSGRCSATAWSGSKTLNNSNPLPAAYRPANACDFYSSDAVGSRAHISIATTGIISANLPSGATGTWFAEINGTVPLN